jgi:hypothetical protein
MNYQYATQYWLQIDQNRFFIPNAGGYFISPSDKLYSNGNQITIPITKWIDITQRLLIQELTSLPEIMYIKKVRVDLEQAMHYWVIINSKLLHTQVDEKEGINITIQFDQIISTETLEQALREFKLQYLIG